MLCSMGVCVCVCVCVNPQYPQVSLGRKGVNQAELIIFPGSVNTIRFCY